MTEKIIIIALALVGGLLPVIMNLFKRRSANNPIPENVKDVYDEETYTVSAFVFESKESAWTFAKEISGSNYQKLNEELGRNHFHYSQVKSFLGVFSSRKSMIISDNKILLIEGSGSAKDYAAFVDFVMRHLPQKVDFTK